MKENDPSLITILDAKKPIAESSKKQDNAGVVVGIPPRNQDQAAREQDPEIGKSLR